MIEFVDKIRSKNLRRKQTTKWKGKVAMHKGTVQISITGWGFML